ncbi:MAG: hypothetical protein JWM11_6157 [Planctomycetaceae bacterium]|nr:hypothetical protein [Planctomycetaceae bacterium]
MTAWLSQFFLHPSFVLPGAALVALPVIIHLINRMRFRRVRFAAMEFLLLSQQRNRRKLLLEQLLLLFLRMLAVVLLVALIARPFFDPSQLLILAGQKTHHVVLLDDSGSMDETFGGTSAFRSALETVRKLGRQGVSQAGTQNLTLLLLSQPDQPLFTQASLDPQLIGELEIKLENLKCSHRGLNLVTGLQVAGQQLKNPAASKHLHVIADFRNRDWGLDSAVASSLKELEGKGIDINLVRSTPSAHDNLAIIELAPIGNVAAANIELRLRTKIKNLGDRAIDNIRLSVMQDGQKLPRTEMFDRLEPNAEVEREFGVVFDKAGQHEVHVVLPEDSLEADNIRYLTVNLSPSNPVLIISGNFESGKSDRKAADLRDALAPEPGRTPFTPEINNVGYLRREALDKFGSIYLVDVPEMPEDALRAVEKYVATGGGLVWLVGPKVRPGFYNEKIYKSGTGIFPVPLGAVTDLISDPENPVQDIQFENHPIFRKFLGQNNSHVQDVRVSKYFGVARDWQPPPTVQVIGRFRDKAPAFLEQNYGKGKVIACLTSAGVDWTSWPRSASYVPLQLELQQYITRPEGSRQTEYLVGQPIDIVLDPTQYKDQLEIRPPDATAIVRLTAARSKTDEDLPGAAANSQFHETFRNTDDPGIYTIRRFKTDNSEDPEILAFNVPATESELALAETAEMKQRLGNGSRIKIHEYGDFSWIQSRQAGQEIREMLLYLILAVLLFEQLLAMRLSYHLNTGQPRPQAEKLRRGRNPAIQGLATAASKSVSSERSEKSVTGGRA